MKNRFSLHLAALGLAFLWAACSSPPGEAAVEEAQTEFVEEPDSIGEPATGLVLPDICELLPADEVAALSGGTLSSEPNSSEYSDDYKGCWYDFELSDGSYDYYIVYVSPAPFLEVVFDDAAEPVSGLGDRAQLKWEEGEEQYRLAILDGNVGVEVIGKRSDVMMELARLILERL